MDRLLGYYYAYKAETAPNDPGYSQPWGLANMQATRAWDYTQGSREVIIAVVDTGIVYDHPDLNANMWRNPGETPGNNIDDDANGIIDDVYGVTYNGLLFNGDPQDDGTADWHGTHIAGIAGAVGNNALGIAGINWRVSLMAVKVLHGPLGEGAVADIIKGIDYAIAKGAAVINLSVVIPGYSTALAEALTRADKQGILTVSAAGNAKTNNDESPYSPAAIRTPNNIAVAAINRNDSKASYSNYGRLTVDLAAPGGEPTPTDGGIYSTIGTLSSPAGDNYGYLAGTSMATPHVSGLATLLKAYDPNLSHHQIKAHLLNGVRALPTLQGITISGGTADAYKSLTVGDLPAVFRVAPASAYVGDTLTITGVNFGNAADRVTAGAVELPLASSWSDDTLQVTVPPELPTTYTWLQVTGAGSGFFVRRLNRLPTVTLSAEPASGLAPLTVTLTAEANDDDGSIVRYEWDLGDGTFSTDTAAGTLQHTFTTAGDYPLRVRVSDNDGGSTIATTSLAVTASGGDSRCFIATAAFGSPLAQEVMTLRRFRDRHLLTNGAGRALVAAYYTLSPPVADFIRERHWARQAVRALLRPLAGVVGWIMKEAQAGSSRPHAPATVAGEYLVGFGRIDEERARKIIAEEGGVLREFDGQSGHGLAVFAAQRPPQEIIDRLLRHEEIRYAEPNRLARKPARPRAGE